MIAHMTTGHDTTEHRSAEAPSTWSDFGAAVLAGYILIVICYTLFAVTGGAWTPTAGIFLLQVGTHTILCSGLALIKATTLHRRARASAR